MRVSTMKPNKKKESAININKRGDKQRDGYMHRHIVWCLFILLTFSLLPASVVTGKRTSNALYDNGTMRDPVTQKDSSSIYEEEYVKPETHFLDTETLNDVTLGELKYLLGNILRTRR